MRSLFIAVTLWSGNIAEEVLSQHTVVSRSHNQNRKMTDLVHLFLALVLDHDMII